jgi:L-methionine (R)-S-oxide reductase
MTKELILPESGNKQKAYELLLPQIESLVHGEDDLIANLANIVAVLKQGLHYFWVGFYLVKNGDLVLGPFQGPVACTHISKGKGVCGLAAVEAKTVLVEDVNLFPGHIACSSESKSEIVLPACKNGSVFLVLDVDSDKVADFDETDKIWLEKLMKIIETLL